MALFLLGSAAAAAEKLGHLRQFIGKYPDEQFMELPEIDQPLKRLLGGKISHFRQNLGVYVPMDFIQGHLVATGCQPHNCRMEKTILAVNLLTGQLTVAIMSQCRTIHIYSQATDNWNYLPVAVQKWVEEVQKVDCRTSIGPKIIYQK
jgi:hypothetical protein